MYRFAGASDADVQQAHFLNKPVWHFLRIDDLASMRRTRAHASTFTPRANHSRDLHGDKCEDIINGKVLMRKHLDPPTTAASSPPSRDSPTLRNYSSRHSSVFKASANSFSIAVRRAISLFMSSLWSSVTTSPRSLSYFEPLPCAAPADRRF